MKITYAGIIIDFQGMPYLTVMQNLSNLNLTGIDAVITSSPFKGYNGAIKPDDDSVYDFFDTGNKFQRGSYSTFYGDSNSFIQLSEYLKSRKILYYAGLNLFFQKESYNKSLWSRDDFLPDSINYSERYILDISNTETAGKLDKIISFIKSLPVAKWILDLRDLPDGIREEYSDFAARRFGSSVLLFTGTNNSEISTDLYWELRRSVFIMPVPDFDLLDRISINRNKIHYIESDSFSVNNCAAFAFLYSNGLKLVIPGSFLNNFNISLIKFLNGFSLKNKILISKEKMVWMDKNKILAFNFGDSPSVIKINDVSGRTGIYKSVEGSSVLDINDQFCDIFMLPESFAFWNISER